MDREKEITGASEQMTGEIKSPMNIGEVSLDNQAQRIANPTASIPEENSKEENLSPKEEKEREEVSPAIENMQIPEADDDQEKPVEKIEETPVSQENEEQDEAPASPLPTEMTTTGDTAVQAEPEQKEVADSDIDRKEDENETEEEEEDKQEDYTNYTKKELAAVLNGLLKEDNIKKVDKILKEIKPFYDELREAARAQALERFIEEGGDAADFDYKPDEVDIRFDADYTLLRERRSKHYSSIEKQKEDNLATKNRLLEQLRQLVDEEETTASINALKEIQKEWKRIGQIPANQVKSLWANYNALLDRFYDNRSIYFELKELDRRKNLEAKLELCERAENLEKEVNLNKAIKELNDLHEEFRYIGPVPKEDQEPLWQRFKAASDALYDRRRIFIDKLKEDFQENMVAKKVLGDEAQAFLAFDSDRINEWNEKTKQILELQKRWEAVGGLPKEKAKEINKHFWSGFKGFFANKNAFFKKLEGQREENLKMKEGLVEQAEALKDSRDWDTTAEALKKLQSEWRAIGPVPDKYRNSIFIKFKKACDHFFEQKRAKNKEVNKEFEENLSKKERICAEIETLAAEKSNDIDKLEVLFDQYQAIGFVPRNAIKSIQNKFNGAVDKFLENADKLSDEEKHNIKLTIKFSKLKNSPNANRKLYQKEGEIRKHISNLENDIVLWRNNLEFFATSKTADKLKEDFDIKIAKAKAELKELKEQLHVIRNI